VNGLEVVRWPTFDEAVNRLKRKYPRVEEDLQDALASPWAPRALPGFANKLWKLRAGSRDQGRGKSGGFRIIYFHDLVGDPRTLFLITIYAKTEREDLEIAELQQIYSRFLAFLMSHRKG
jgi:mRNA-degrading endonuclease RelE of RelBE toxin-antitoxin system